MLQTDSLRECATWGAGLRGTSYRCMSTVMALQKLTTTKVMVTSHCWRLKFTPNIVASIYARSGCSGAAEPICPTSLLYGTSPYDIRKILLFLETLPFLCCWLTTYHPCNLHFFWATPSPSQCRRHMPTVLYLCLALEPLILNILLEDDSLPKLEIREGH